VSSSFEISRLKNKSTSLPSKLKKNWSESGLEERVASDLDRAKKERRVGSLDVSSTRFADDLPNRLRSSEVYHLKKQR